MPDVKMVPVTDLIAVKAKVAKLQGELSQRDQRISALENAVKIAKANGEDSAEVEMVKQALLTQAKELEDNRTKYETDWTSLKAEKREARAKELAGDLKAKGVEIEHTSLLEAEDMDQKSKDFLLEFQGKELERLKAQPNPNSPESVFEGGAGGVLKRSISDIDVKTEEGRKELAVIENRYKQRAYAVK